MANHLFETSHFYFSAMVDDSVVSPVHDNIGVKGHMWTQLRTHLRAPWSHIVVWVPEPEQCRHAMLISNVLHYLERFCHFPCNIWTDSEMF